MDDYQESKRYRTWDLLAGPLEDGNGFLGVVEEYETDVVWDARIKEFLPTAKCISSKASPDLATLVEAKRWCEHQFDGFTRCNIINLDVETGDIEWDTKVTVTGEAAAKARVYTLKATP